MMEILDMHVEPCPQTTGSDTAVNEEVKTDGEENAEEGATENAKNNDVVVSSNASRKKRGRKPKKVDDDVCFICYDGGELVLCDRRSCPKAYHPICVGRDASFFTEKGVWTCDWHFCSSCGKPAKFQCYTCTFSICKLCIKGVDFFWVKKSRGFCEHCLQLALMIEEKKDADSDGVKVDFTDKETYEYLFKEYWLEIKDKESLTLAELQKAHVPSKDSEDCVKNDVDSDETFEADGSSSSDEIADWGDVEQHNMGPKKRRKRRSSTMVIIDDDVEMEDEAGRKGISMARESNSWASKELIEFIEFINEDTKIARSHFEVKRLLWKYIVQNKLQGSRRKSQIICDDRLFKLFGKNIVGPWEVPKLLESHIVSKQSFSVQGNSKCEFQDLSLINDYNKIEVDFKERVGTYKRQKSQKKTEDKAPKVDTNGYAAINVHNISLVYLRRDLLEDLLGDLGSFNNKVVGSFVRIKVAGIGYRPEVCHRLVQVIGTRKVQEAYVTGRRTTDVVLEVLNLNKEENVSIDAVSNQDFTEEECQRLRQSIKYGLIKRPTVGELEEKAKVLHEAKLNDWLETEILKLSHLRDRASEKGHRKELREFVERLQLLKSPGERDRKLQETPEVIVDPNLDLDIEEEEKLGNNNGGNWGASPESSGKIMDKNIRDKSDWGHSGWEREHAVAGGNAGESSHGQFHAQNKFTDGNWEKEMGEQDYKPNECSGQKWSQRMDNQCNTIGSQAEKNAGGNNSWSQLCDGTTAVPSRSDWRQGRIQAHKSPSFMTKVLSRTNPRSTEVDSEAQKIWHYQDPTGTIQGPFSMLQLRRWNRTGLFPLDLRIWKTLDQQEDSVLLTDALAGRFEMSSTREDKSDSEWMASCKNTGIGVNNSGAEREGNAMSTVKDSEVNDLSRKTNWEVGNASNVVEASSANASEIKTNSENQSLGWDDCNTIPSLTKSGNDGWGATLNTKTTWTSTSAVEAPITIDDGWGGGVISGTWDQTENPNVIEVAERETRGSEPSYCDTDPIGNADKNPPSDGCRLSRTSKKDIPCKFHGRGFCKRGSSCEFHHG